VRIVAFSTEAAPVPLILTYIGEPAAPPRIARPADRPPGMICSNHCRTGTRWRNPHRNSSSISAFPGKHRHRWHGGG